ncbi:MAG: DUF3617 family protein [Bdellovibrionota bacterium]
MIQIFFSFLLFSSVLNAQSVEPGIWQADSSFEINGIPLPDSQEKECITADEAKDIKKTITMELGRHGCASTKWVVKDKKVEVSLKCTKSGLEATGNLRGNVSAKNYNLKGEAEGTYKNIPSEASIVLKGKWIKSCAK